MNHNPTSLPPPLLKANAHAYHKVQIITHHLTPTLIFIVNTYAITYAHASQPLHVVPDAHHP
jgi:hypothetical protein